MSQSQCQNCLKVWDDEDLDEIKDLEMRVESGEPMPSGECPECGALCQPKEEVDDAELETSKTEDPDG